MAFYTFTLLPAQASTHEVFAPVIKIFRDTGVTSGRYSSADCILQDQGYISAAIWRTSARHTLSGRT